MEKVEKVRILSAAVKAAENNGFDFQAWYCKQMNIGENWEISIETRINHMCYLGIETVLIYSHDFIRKLIKRGWKNFLRTAVIKNCPVNLLWQFMFDRGILDE